ASASARQGSSGTASRGWAGRSACLMSSAATGRPRGVSRRSARLPEVDVDEPLGGAREPGLGDELAEVLDGQALQAREDRRVAIEVWGGEEDARVIGEQRLLGPDVLHARGQDRPRRRGG